MAKRAFWIAIGVLLSMTSLSVWAQIEVLHPQERVINPTVSASTSNKLKLPAPVQNAFANKDRAAWRQSANVLSLQEMPRQLLQSQKPSIVANSLPAKMALPVVSERKLVGTLAKTQVPANRLPARLRGINAFTQSQPKPILSNSLPSSSALKGLQPLRPQERLILSNSLPELGSR